MVMEDDGSPGIAELLALGRIGFEDAYHHEPCAARPREARWIAESQKQPGLRASSDRPENEM